ncbi:hypothetical protein ACIBCT_08555 [Streptosporangium sp. NPDC050855]|uniref:hypothetical protein n=1 Tax=Streptosporangium sp. NPDC050855 TaxID=3366194 RepID=UPI003792BD2E
MMAAARQALRRGRAQDLELSPAALEPAAETDIDPAAIRTHILLTLHRELIRRR